jgi:hypothetical protein
MLPAAMEVILTRDLSILPNSLAKSVANAASKVLRASVPALIELMSLSRESVDATLFVGGGGGGVGVDGVGVGVDGVGVGVDGVGVGVGVVVPARYEGPCETRSTRTWMELQICCCRVPAY